MERTVILYHGDCPDGFGGAYAAWKKFGDSAEYIGLHRNAPLTAEFEGAHLYFIDFTYPKEIMDEYVRTAASVTVLDHHEGVEDVITAMPEYRYAIDKSGATIAWEYFHPGESTPRLLQFVEDDDLFRFALPDTRPVICYLIARDFTFESWDRIAYDLEQPETAEPILTKARAYAEYFELLAQQSVEKAKLVHFEGYDVLFANAHPSKPFKSLVGNLLAKKQPPFGIVASAHPLGFGISLRGDGSVDLTKIAQKYGGNGHYSSVGFALPVDAPMPWTIVEPDPDA